MLDGLSRYLAKKKVQLCPASGDGRAQLMGGIRDELLLRLHRLRSMVNRRLIVTTTGAISPVRTNRR